MHCKGELRGGGREAQGSQACFLIPLPGEGPWWVSRCCRSAVHDGWPAEPAGVTEWGAAAQRSSIIRPNRELVACTAPLRAAMQAPECTVHQGLAMGGQCSQPMRVCPLGGRQVELADAIPHPFPPPDCRCTRQVGTEQGRGIGVGFTRGACHSNADRILWESACPAAEWAGTPLAGTQNIMCVYRRWWQGEEAPCTQRHLARTSSPTTTPTPALAGLPWSAFIT